MVEEEDDDEEEEEENGDDEDVDDDVHIIMKEEKNKGVDKGISRSCEHQHCRTCKAWSIGSSSAAPNLEDDEIDAEMYIQPGNPYFYAKHYRPNELYIPKNVIKEFCLCFTKFITLVCCHCKDVQRNAIAGYHHILPQINTAHTEKRGEIRKWKDGRVFVQGWEDFRRKSKIKENDICLCELVLLEGKSIEMLRVHVVRKE